MRICLIKCPSPFLIDDKVFPPLGLMAVGTVWKKAGHEIYIHDGSVETIPTGYDLYGLGPTTPEYKTACEIASKLDGDVIFGGPHVNKYVDYDHLIIDRSLIDIHSYKYYINGRLATTIVTATGCPYKCAFCSKGPLFEARDINLTIKEIETLHFDFGYDALMFFDDTFILNVARVIRICECLKRLGIVWRCFVRADLVVKQGYELLDIMADSGCFEVGMGIESGSDTILANINKGESSATMKKAIKMLKNVGIRVKVFFIVGLPGESHETLDETRYFLDDIEIDDADFTVFRPYPGSPIYENKDSYDIQWDALEYPKMFYKGKPGEYSNLVWTSELSSEQIVMARDKMEKAYK